MNCWKFIFHCVYDTVTKWYRNDRRLVERYVDATVVDHKFLFHWTPVSFYYQMTHTPLPQSFSISLRYSRIILRVIFYGFLHIFFCQADEEKRKGIGSICYSMFYYIICYVMRPFAPATACRKYSESSTGRALYWWLQFQTCNEEN